MTPDEIQARCLERQTELLHADDLIDKAQSALTCSESDHVFQALRQVRREITLALNNVAYDEAKAAKASR